MFKLLIVDDHPLVGIALKAVLQGRGVIGEVEIALDGNDGRRRLGVFRPDLALVDIDLPDMSGIDLIRIIREMFPTTRVLVFSGKRYELFATQLAQLGVSGFVSKTEDMATIAETVELAAQGHRFLVPEPAAPDGCNPFAKLTEREMSIAQLLVKGYANREIGVALSISEKTVAVHKMKILRKLGLPGAVELALLAQRYGLA